MSIIDYRAQRLDRNHARKLILEIAQRHPAQIRFSNHALEEMRKDNMTTVDVFNIIKSPSAKILHEGEMERGTYRYRLETQNMMVVVAFDSKTSLAIVTAWRKQL